MLERGEIGKIGENMAVDYLKKKGWRILKRNYREKFDEIDIIAHDPARRLIFVEVKTLSGEFKNLTPEDNLTFAKKRKLIRACQLFANKNESLMNRSGWRLDLLAITLRSDSFSIHHYENIA